MTKEQEYWSRVVCELQELFTLAYLAKEMGVSERQVSNWKDGDRPLGLTAIRLYEFHAKHRTRVQVSGTAVHVQVEGSGIIS